MLRPTIRLKLFSYIFSVSILSLLIISLGVYFLFFQTLEKNETKYAVQTSDVIKQRIEFVLNLIHNTANSLGSNEALMKELGKKADPSSTEYQKGQNEISTMLQNIIGVQEHIMGIYILTPKGKLYSSNQGVNEYEIKGLLKDYINNPNKAREYFTGEHEVSFHPSMKSKVISYIRPVFSSDSGKLIGTVVIDIDYNLMKQIFTIWSIENNERIMVIGSKGENIFSYPYNVILDDILKENPELMTSDKMQLNAQVFGSDSIIVSNTIDYTNWKIIRVISSKDIHHDTMTIESTAIYGFILFILFSFIGSFLLSSALTTPIKDLNRKMKLVEKGDLSVKIDVKSKDEIGELSNSFNKMVIKLKALIDTLLEEQKRKSDMEFQILQAQINPHFLYNTLDSIKWLAVIKNVNTISDMTTSLINLLKYNISRNSVTVTLSEELESVNNYIKIQKYRYGDIFTIDYNIDEKTQDCIVLRFILQPMVENAIIHGFENIEENGVIKISSRIENNNLVIDVEDNGSGMDETTLGHIERNEDLKKKFSSIGIQNILERIQAYFGDEYGLHFESKLNLGTKVSLKLPVIRKEE